MADLSHLGSQFHEMTRDEFESQPGTWFHGTPTGVIGQVILLRPEHKGRGFLSVH
jgi:hypothetical protein